MIAMFQGRILELPLDPVCYSVIVAAMKQGEMIEDVCRETHKQAEMEIITLAQDRHGHQVVLAMLSGTRQKHIHNILILCINLYVMFHDGEPCVEFKIHDDNLINIECTFLNLQ